MKKIVTVLALITCCLAFPVGADMFQGSPSCSKPFKPSEFRDDSHFRRFMAEVEDYRECIEDFIEEQSSAIEVHRDAAEKAAQEWDRYVQWELQ